MTPHTLIAATLVLLAGATGLAWPQYPVWTPPSGTVWPIESVPLFPPTRPPVRTIPYPSPIGLTQAGFEDRWQPVWELMAQQAMAQQAVAQTVPMPPERPTGAPSPANTGIVGDSNIKGLEPYRKRMARDDADICARHNLKKTYVTKWRWKCLP